MVSFCFGVRPWTGLAAIVGVLCGLACLGGCKPKFEASPDAVAWKGSQRDAGEDSRQPGCWPGWRGPGASGVAHGGSPPVEFGPGKAERWKAAVPGFGNSSPCVWNDRIFLTTAVGDAAPYRLLVLCYDHKEGKLLWQADAGTTSAPTHIKNGYASATCATDGRHVYASFGGGGLFCFDFSGKQIWQADLGALEHMWGTAASPVLYGDAVIQLCESEKESCIAAFDKRTGKRLWKTDRPSLGCWTTPVLAPVGEGGVKRTELIVNGTTHQPSGSGWVIAYDPDDGRELWRVAGTESLVTPTAIASGGLVFSTSGRNGAIMAIRPGGEGDVTATRVVWKASRGGPYIPTGVAYRNRLYVLSDKDALTCYNPGDGQTIWRARLGGVYTSSLVAADGRIYAVSESGRASIVKAGDEFQLLATNELGEPCYATPAIADGDLLVRTRTTLCCFAGKKAAAAGEPAAEKPPSEKLPAKDPPAEKPPKKGESAAQAASQPKTEDASDHDALGGPQATTNCWSVFRGDGLARGVAACELPKQLEVVWSYAVDRGGFEATAAICDGTVVAGCTDGNLYAFDLATGEKRWVFSTKLGFTAPAAIKDGKVFLGDVDGCFYAVDLKTGKKLWQFNADNEISGGANFFGDTVLFGSQDGNLYCLKAASGEVAWKYEAPDQIRCFPSIAGDSTLVAGCDGRLHRVDLHTGKETSGCALGSPTGSTAAILGDVAYVGTEEGELLAIDCKEEKVVWRYRNPKSVFAIRSSAAAAPDLIVVGSRDKHVHALDPKTGESRWSFATKGQVDSSPVIVGDRVYVGSSDGRIYGLDRKTGEERWQFDAGGQVLASPAVAAGRLVIGNHRGTLYCFGKKKS